MPVVPPPHSHRYWCRCEGPAWKVCIPSAPFADTFDSEFVTGFKNKKLSNNCKGDYTINCADEEYIYFAIPSSMANNLVFHCGGFEGGFELVADNTSIENIYGSTCDYDIYRSNNHSLGQTTITIK